MVDYRVPVNQYLTTVVACDSLWLADGYLTAGYCVSLGYFPLPLLLGKMIYFFVRPIRAEFSVFKSVHLICYLEKIFQ